jgi:hypothetical protein
LTLRSPPLRRSSAKPADWCGRGVNVRRPEKRALKLIFGP